MDNFTQAHPKLVEMQNDRLNFAFSPVTVQNFQNPAQAYSIWDLGNSFDLDELTIAQKICYRFFLDEGRRTEQDWFSKSRKLG